MGSIHVTNLGKAYKQYANPWSRVAEWISPFAKPKHRLKWVLKDIDFHVAPGEAVGIIGLNGAGKSTLLKLITGTTQPTVGKVELTGSVAALLELGMGFHPDFTGRQNALMAGQLLGLNTEEMHALMPDIEAFAEIGDYIDQPVRIYSSGMQMRLAFSVATVKRPDILIVDEALSVGDAYFQHKSFARIRAYREAGTTLLLVSHDKTSIQSVCDRAILLDAGRVAKEGAPEAIMDFYNAMLAQRENEAVQTVHQENTDSGKTRTVSGTGEAAVLDIALLNAQGERVEAVDVGSIVTLEIKASAHISIPQLVLGYMIKDRLGQPMFGTNTFLKNYPIEDVQPAEAFVYRFTFPMNLGPGSYSITTALTSTETHLVNNYEWRDLALVFSVVNIGHSPFTGCAWLDPSVDIQRITPHASYNVSCSVSCTQTAYSEQPPIQPPIQPQTLQQTRLQAAEAQALYVEDTVRKGEQRARQAEMRARNLEERLQQAETQLAAVYASTSWKATAPLRYARNIVIARPSPRVLAKQLAKQLAAWLIRRVAPLAQPIVPVLRRNPVLVKLAWRLRERFPVTWERLRRLLKPATSVSTAPGGLVSESSPGASSGIWHQITILNTPFKSMLSQELQQRRQHKKSKSS